MFDNLANYKIVLASNSPRRRELLAGLGITYDVITLPHIDESYPSTLTAEQIPLHIASSKSQAYRDVMSDNTLLITADTIVWMDNKVYGKPSDADDARRMLHELSGRTHTVITAVALTTTHKHKAFAVSTQVTFAPLSSHEIDYYVDNYHPLDKAGAYGIQEWIGYIGVTSLEGSYFNVMGLPIQRLYNELKKW